MPPKRELGWHRRYTYHHTERRTLTSKIPSSLSSGKDKTITFHRFPSHIWHDQNLSLQERVVLCRVWSFLPRRCYLSYEQWAKELGCHRVTAINLLNKLVTTGRLLKNRAPEGSNEWQLVVPDYHLEGPIEVASSVGLLPLVASDYPPSSPTLPVVVVSDYPRRSLEDQLKDQVEDHSVADALTTPTLAESATPSPSSTPKPKTKAKKKPFPDEAYWSEAFPSIFDWMKAKGFNGSDAAAKSWFDQCVERMRDACEANPTKYRYDNWEAAFKNWYRDRLPRVRESGLTDKELDYLFDFVWSDVRGDPVIPEAPMIDDEEVTLIKNVLVSMFDVEYEKTMKEKNADEKRFYIKQFKEKYEQAIKNKRKQNGR